MKKMPKLITQLELNIAFNDGKIAYCEGRRRSFNPYIEANDELAHFWWKGWDWAHDETNAWEPSPSKDEPL